MLAACQGSGVPPAMAGVEWLRWVMLFVCSADLIFLAVERHSVLGGAQPFAEWGCDC